MVVERMKKHRDLYEKNEMAGYKGGQVLIFELFTVLSSMARALKDRIARSSLSYCLKRR